MKTKVQDVEPRKMMSHNP